MSTASLGAEGASADSLTNAGLDGVVVAETRLSRVDGQNGRLVYRGVDLERAVAELSFEGMAALLWSDEPALARAPEPA